MSRSILFKIKRIHQVNGKGRRLPLRRPRATSPHSLWQMSTFWGVNNVNYARRFKNCKPKGYPADIKNNTQLYLLLTRFADRYSTDNTVRDTYMVCRANRVISYGGSQFHINLHHDRTYSLTVIDISDGRGV